MSSRRRPDTILTHAGLAPEANHGVVNPPVYHASTILFPSLADLADANASQFQRTTYGRGGTPTTRALETAVAELEGGHDAVATGSGLAAITLALMAFTAAGDRVLVSDSVYAPTRIFLDKVLGRYGVKATYYDPAIGAGIADLLSDDVKIVFMESPGSITFEIQDVPAIAAAARARGVLTMIDNTWATPLFFRPFAHGVDLSIHAATKYIVGHSDAMMGLIVCAAEAHWLAVKNAARQIGHAAAPDDVYLAQRGLRTMGVRLRHHQDAALEVAGWLQARPEVARVLHPGLPGAPGHDLWKRDFTGASGLFAIELHPVDAAAIARMVDGMELFGIGYSWGGFESLIIPQDTTGIRSAVKWGGGPLIRLHIGLEDVEDLKADLAAGLARLAG